MEESGCVVPRFSPPKALEQLADVSSFISICTKKYLSEREGAVDDDILLTSGRSSSEEPIWREMRMKRILILAGSTSTAQRVEIKNIDLM